MIRKVGFVSAVLALTVAAAFACSSSTTSSSGSSPWVGNYTCTGTESGMLTAPTMTTVTQNLTFNGTVTESGSTLTATAEPGDSGNVPCVLVSTANGNTATLNASPAQTCTQITTLGTVTVTYTSGTFTLSGTTFTGSFNIGVSGPATGTGTFTISCTQQ
jgi:hypothetical protein